MLGHFDALGDNSCLAYTEDDDCVIFFDERFVAHIHLVGALPLAEAPTPVS